MRKLLKWSLRGAGVILALLVLVAATIAIILNTEGGTRWALTRIDSALSGTLVVETFEGTFWQGLAVPTLSYRDKDLRISATDVRLELNWSDVIAGRVELRSFAAETIEIVDSSPPSPQRLPFTLAMQPLPVDLAIVSGVVDEFTLIQRGEVQIIEDIRIADARLDGNAIRVSSIEASGVNIRLTAQDLKLKLDGAVPAAAKLSWALKEGDWSGWGVIDGSLEALTFEHTVSGPYPGVATGTVKLLHKIEPEFDLVVRWDDWSFSGYHLLNGSVAVDGSASRYDAVYSGVLLLPDAKEISVTGLATGDTEQLSSFSANVDTYWGRADLLGELSWLPEFSLSTKIDAANVDPAVFAEPLSGALNVATTLTVDSAGTVSLNDLTVEGVLNAAAIVANGDVVLGAERVRCNACTVKVGENLLRVEGQTFNDQIDLSVLVDAPNLSQFWPDIAGTAKGSGRLLGLRARPRFTGELEARELRLGEWAAISVSVDSQDSSLDSLDFRADVANLRGGEVNYGTFSVQGQGSPAELQLDARWQIHDLQVDAAAVLRTTDTDLSGSIHRATISEPQTGAWRLQEALGFTFGEKEFSIQPHSWLGDSGELRVSRLVVAGDESEIVANVERLPMNLADPFLPTGLNLLGFASAKVNLARRAGDWVGTVDWQQSDTVLRVAGINEQTTDVRVPRADLSANFRDGGVAAKAAVSIEPGVTGEVDFTLDKLDADAHMEADLRLQGDDWGWISALVPEVDGLTGSIAAQVSASGPLTVPEFSGDLVWRDGGVLIPAFNVPLENIDLRISGAANGTATLEATAKAGSGTLAVRGNFDELMQATRSVTLQVSGTSAKLLDWPEYRVWGSPDATIIGDASGWRVNGELMLPRAQIELREVPVDAIRVSDDVVVIGDEAVDRTRTRVSGKVRLVLGDKVRVKALGLDTGLSGELSVRLRKTRETTAEGKIQLVAGSFAAQGQKLAIQKGELTFTGPLDDPIVDVRAVRVIENFDGTITVGIHLYGRAQNLTSTVFAEPAMNEVDALSYLVLGRPLSQATESEGGELSGAAVSLGLRQATVLTEQIGQSLGLDQLSLSGDGSDTTALIAGKKINSRLYARYAYGVFSRIGTLLLRYRLSSRLTLEAGAGEQQSIDILYSVEKE